MGREDVVNKLARIHNLPTLPPIIEKLGKAVNNPDSDAKMVADIIEDDPSMMARILKVVNSAFYGVAEPIHSVQRAIAQMGLVAVNNIAMSTSVFSTFSKKGETNFNREEFWRHSISAGIAANIIYEKAEKNVKQPISKDVLHLAGLMHDIGKIIFEQFFHDDFMKAIALSGEKKTPLHQAETEIFGIDHAEVGAWLASKWKLSNMLTETIRRHHEPALADESTRDLANICHVANYICNLQKIGDSGDAAPVFQHTAWKSLGLGIPDVAKVVDRINEEAKESETLLAFME